MANNKQIAILLEDTLLYYGIERILKEYFSPLEISYFTNSSSFLKKQPDFFDFYLTDSNVYITNLDFFLPRRSKVIVLINKKETKIPNNNIISSQSSLETILEKLGSILLSETNVNGDNNKDLSSREINVLQEIVHGYTNKEIADHLNISLNTVLTHRKNITTKLGIKTVSGLTFYAIMNGLISGEEIGL